MKRADKKQKFFNLLNSLGKPTATLAEIKSACTESGMKSAYFFTKQEENRVGRGLYHVPNALCNMQTNVIPMSAVVEKSKDKIIEETKKIP